MNEINLIRSWTPKRTSNWRKYAYFLIDGLVVVAVAYLFVYFYAMAVYVLS